MAKQKALTDPALTDFVSGYLQAALWSSSDEDGVPFDQNYSEKDFAKKTIEGAIADCLKFMTSNKSDLDQTGADDSTNGHDFWLTRNGHGAGFWDRGYGEVGDRLTKAAKAFGEATLYAGDDGKLYFA
jgi:hypothetical protein